MSILTIDKKDYVVIAKHDYDALLTMAATKTVPVRKMSLQQGKKMAYQLIDQWAKGK